MLRLFIYFFCSIVHAQKYVKFADRLQHYIIEAYHKYIFPFSIYCRMYYCNPENKIYWIGKLELVYKLNDFDAMGKPSSKNGQLFISVHKG